MGSAWVFYPLAILGGLLAAFVFVFVLAWIMDDGPRFRSGS